MCVFSSAKHGPQAWRRNIHFPILVWLFAAIYACRYPIFYSMQPWTLAARLLEVCTTVHKYEHVNSDLIYVDVAIIIVGPLVTIGYFSYKAAKTSADTIRQIQLVVCLAVITAVLTLCPMVLEEVVFYQGRMDYYMAAEHAVSVLNYCGCALPALVLLAVRRDLRGALRRERRERSRLSLELANYPSSNNNVS